MQITLHAHPPFTAPGAMADFPLFIADPFGGLIVFWLDGKIA